MTTLAEQLAYAIVKGACEAVIEHLPQIRAALTPTAREAADDPSRQSDLRDAQQDAMARGDLPPPAVGT